MTDRQINVLQDLFLRNKTKAALKKKSKFPQSLIDDFYKNQEFTQVFKTPFDLEKKAYNVQSFIGRYFADEMFLKIKAPNGQTKKFYILGGVEIFTKYVWVEISDRPHTQKSTESLMNQIKRSKLPINFVKTDNAPIFNVISKYTQHYKSVAFDNLHNAQIERFFLTLRSRVNQETGEMRPARFRTYGARDIARIVKEYNEEDIHSSTNMVPKRVIQNRNHERAILRKVYFAQHELDRQREPDVKIGDIIRISMKYIQNNVFEKRSVKQNYTYTLFRVVEKKPNHGYKVLLLDNKIHVSDPVDKISKVLKYDIMEKYMMKIDYDAFRKYNIIDQSKYIANTSSNIKKKIPKKKKFGKDDLFPNEKIQIGRREATILNLNEEDVDVDYGKNQFGKVKYDEITGRL